MVIRRLFLLLAIGYWLLASSVFAADFVVSPAILDWEGERGDEFRVDLKLSNPTGLTVPVWPYVADLNPSDGSIRESFGPTDDPAHRLGAWLQTPRDDFILRPGQERTIPVTVKIGARAEPGTYHAIVAFPYGDNQFVAFRSAVQAARATITVRVRDDIHEQINVVRFKPLRRLFTSLPASLALTLSNGGNTDSIVNGRVRIFDRSGNEVGDVAVAGESGLSLKEGTEQALDIAWSGNDVGRFKAFLDLRYGKTGTITDSAFFWLIPWWAAALFIGVVVLVAVAAARIASRHHRKVS